MSLIQDGKGRGFSAAVNKSNRLEVKAVTEPEFEQASEDGLAYNWTSDTVDLGPNDTVLLVKNTSDTNLHIESISVANGSIASEYTIHLPTTEVTVTGTVIVGTNLNTGNANVADANAATQESNNVQGNVIATALLLANTNVILLTPGLILAKNKSVALDVVVGTTSSSSSIVGHYESE